MATDTPYFLSIPIGTFIASEHSSFRKGRLKKFQTTFYALLDLISRAKRVCRRPVRLREPLRTRSDGHG